MRTPRIPLVPAVLLALVSFLGASPAHAESIIKHPGDHPKYSFEAEPHLAVDLFGRWAGVGPGFRGTLVLVDNGFISSINNSVGLGFGADWIFFGDRCEGPPGLRACHDTSSDVVLPVVLQWNFWLAPQWSVFGEPGLAFHLHGGRDHVDVDWFTIYGGGRYHFSDAVALTLRVGAPFFNDNVVSIGASFFL
ncbi:MAG TPA: hypothetical protein VHE30_10555 [Polyangiaceae bacterium]|nr:hypothetical protein [Polyangiaceae bacterium]